MIVTTLPFGQHGHKRTTSMRDLWTGVRYVLPLSAAILGAACAPTPLAQTSDDVGIEAITISPPCLNLIEEASPGPNRLKFRFFTGGTVGKPVVCELRAPREILQIVEVSSNPPKGLIPVVLADKRTFRITISSTGFVGDNFSTTVTADLLLARPAPPVKPPNPPPPKPPTDCVALGATATGEWQLSVRDTRGCFLSTVAITWKGNNEVVTYRVDPGQPRVIRTRAGQPVMGAVTGPKDGTGSPVEPSKVECKIVDGPYECRNSSARWVYLHFRDDIDQSDGYAMVRPGGVYRYPSLGGEARFKVLSIEYDPD